MKTQCPRCKVKEKTTSGYCTPCGTLRKREWRASNSIKKIPYFYRERIQTQEGRCAGCLRDHNNGKRFVVDHDHSTGEKRGLLCHQCNLAVGNAKDDPLILRRLAAYLEKVDPPKLSIDINPSLVEVVSVHLSRLLGRDAIKRGRYIYFVRSKLNNDLLKNGIPISDQDICKALRVLGWRSKTLRLGERVDRCWVKRLEINTQNQEFSLSKY